VRRELRSESEALQFWTKVVNIALMAAAGRDRRDRVRGAAAVEGRRRYESQAVPHRPRCAGRARRSGRGVVLSDRSAWSSADSRAGQKAISGLKIADITRS